MSFWEIKEEKRLATDSNDFVIKLRKIFFINYGISKFITSPVEYSFKGVVCKMSNLKSDRNVRG